MPGLPMYILLPGGKWIGYIGPTERLERTYCRVLILNQVTVTCLQVPT